MLRGMPLVIALPVAVIALRPSAGTAQLSDRQARVEAFCPAPPIPVVVGGRRTLVYELHVTNYGPGPLEFVEIRIAAPGAGPLATLRDSTLSAALEVPGSHRDGVTRLDPGQQLIAFLWVPLAADAPLPAALEHRLLFSLPDTVDQRRDQGTEQAIEGISVPLRRAVPPPSAIRPPVDGTWVVSGPSNTTGHRRSAIALDGKVADAQRYAVDWAKVGPNGNTWQGDEHRNEDYWGFGQPVHAVAAGRIVAAVDSIADNTPHAALPRITPANLPGNYVIEQIGPGRYATYAHLRRGSVRVRPGMRVAAGAVLASVGNTGQTTGPHLHFQVTDGPSVLSAEGVPFVIARYTSFGSGMTFEMDRHPRDPRVAQLPEDGEVVDLP